MDSDSREAKNARENRFNAGPDVECFRDTVLKANEDDPIRKLRWNEPLSKDDLNALEKMLVKAYGEREPARQNSI